MPSKSTRSSSKSSPKKATPARSRSRSRSAARKPRSRSRSRTSTKSLAKKAAAQKSPARPKKAEVQKTPERPVRSPARSSSHTRTTTVVTETPTRVSQRIQEKLLGQLRIISSSQSSSNRDDSLERLSEFNNIVTGTPDKHNDNDGTPDKAGVSESYILPVVSDLNNNAVSKRCVVTKTSYTTDGGQVTKPKAAPAGSDASVGKTGGLLVLTVIGLAFFLALACDKKTCTLLKIPVCPGKWEAFLDVQVATMVVSFYAAITLLSMVPVGSVVEGAPLKDGRKLQYRTNGLFVLTVMTAAFGLAVYRGCPLGYLEQHYLQFITAGVIVSILITIALFIKSRNCPLRDRAPGADGTFLNDIWIGRELNPRIGDLDIKFVLFRATMLSWLLIDWSFLANEFKVTGAYSPALATVVLCHTLYAIMAIRNESVWIMAPDITTNGGGYMFVGGTMITFPLILVLQAKFLVLYPDEGITNCYVLGAILVMNVFGLLMFNGANWQKSEFRRNPYNPALAHLTSIPTKSGKRLLCSGWWGIVRRPNYLGDLIMALAWSLPCGCNYFLPYFYPVYLVLLLVPRCITDEAGCKERYGEAWDKYTSIVKYRLIPYVF